MVKFAVRVAVGYNTVGVVEEPEDAFCGVVRPLNCIVKKFADVDNNLLICGTMYIKNTQLSPIDVTEDPISVYPGLIVGRGISLRYDNGAEGFR